MKKNLEKDTEHKLAEDEKKTASYKASEENMQKDKDVCVEETGKTGEKNESLAEATVPSPEERIAELEMLTADLQNQYLRKVADFDNYRKRMIREKQEAIQFANTNILVDLIDVLDNFDRAIVAGGDHEPGTPASAFSEGISMIRDQFGAMLENKYSLTHYPVVGEHFDPNIHEAVGTQSSAEVTEPTVYEEFVKGYKLKDRVIRLAKVMVRMPENNTKQ